MIKQMIHIWDLECAKAPFMYAVCGRTDHFNDLTVVKPEDIRLVTCPTCKELHNSWERIESGIERQFNDDV